MKDVRKGRGSRERLTILGKGKREILEANEGDRKSVIH